MSSSSSQHHAQHGRPPPRPPLPPALQAGHRPHEHALGPVQALAQAYFRTHARTQSEQLHAYSQHQHGHRPAHPTDGPNRLPLPIGAATTANSASLDVQADELAHRFSQLGSLDTRRPAGVEPSPPSPLKPLPALPPARTPSQHRHQQQNQFPYMPHRPAAASSLHGIAEDHRPSSAPSNPASRPGMYAFPQPSVHGQGSACTQSRPEPRLPQAHPATASSSSYYQPLPRPPVLFPEPHGQMPLPSHLTPPHLPTRLPRPHSAEVPGPLPSPSHDRLRPSPAVAQSSHGRVEQQRPADYFERPHSAQELASRPLPASSPGAHARPASGTPPHSPARRPVLSSAGSEGHLLLPASASSPSAGAASPSRTGLRAALPPPLPGQCWGIKRDGTRCTRKVGKQGAGSAAGTSTPSPKRTPQKANKTATAAGATSGRKGGTKSAGSSPASTPGARGVQRKKTGATRTRPIVLSDSEDDEDDDDDNDDWLVHDSSGDSSTGPRSRSHLLVPPRDQRRHRRSRSAGNNAAPTELRRNVRDAVPARRAGGPSSKEDEDEDGIAPQMLEPAYCFQHVSEINKSPGFYIPREGRAPSGSGGTGAEDLYVSFAEYLYRPDGREMSAQTQASLRSVMSAPLSAADLVGGGGGGSAGEVRARDDAEAGGRGKGYMYIYELRDFSTATEMCLKVGRTSNVFRRMGEWRGQCRRRGAGLILVGFEPSPEGAGAGSSGQRRPAAQGVIGGAAEVWCEGIHGSHKWERLIHLELLDIGHRLDEGSCSDCGARHREIFMIPRHGSGGGGDGDAIEVVRHVVRKWEGLVRRLVGADSSSLAGAAGGGVRSPRR